VTTSFSIQPSLWAAQWSYAQSPFDPSLPISGAAITGRLPRSSAVIRESGVCYSGSVRYPLAAPPQRGRQVDTPTTHATRIFGSPALSGAMSQLDFQLDEFYSRERLSKLLGVSTDTIDRSVRAGRLRALRPSRRRVVFFGQDAWNWLAGMSQNETAGIGGAAQ
jgi:hypothetical protein